MNGLVDVGKWRNFPRLCQRDQCQSHEEFEFRYARTTANEIDNLLRSVQIQVMLYVKAHLFNCSGRKCRRVQHSRQRANRRFASVARINCGKRRVVYRRNSCVGCVRSALLCFIAVGRRAYYRAKHRRRWWHWRRSRTGCCTPRVDRVVH